MNRQILVTLLAATLYCGTGLATPVVTLDPVNGQISGMPGTIVGWGFSVTPDPLEWISFTGSALQDLSSAGLGSYVDFIGPQGGPVNGVLAPGGSAWIQSFDQAMGTGAGTFAIDPAALPGSFETGTITLFYDQFSADPNNCLSCNVGSSTISVPFRVDVAASDVPEPGTTPLLLGLLLLASAKAVKARLRE
jgi:hypothetical protein